MLLRLCNTVADKDICPYVIQIFYPLSKVCFLYGIGLQHFEACLNTCNKIWLTQYPEYFTAIQEYVNPCQPNPCGPNSQCREINGQAVCSCSPTFVGSPPGCRPECVTSSECTLDKACVNQKCTDPCPGTCGTNARCNVNNHSPICSCQSGYTGDPFARCYPNPRKTTNIIIHIFTPKLTHTFSCSSSARYSDCCQRSLCSFTVRSQLSMSKYQWSSFVLLSSHLHWITTEL